MLPGWIGRSSPEHYLNPACTWEARPLPMGNSGGAATPSPALQFQAAHPFPPPLLLSESLISPSKKTMKSDHGLCSPVPRSRLFLDQAKMFNQPCLPTPIGEPWASALTHSGWCGDYAMASVLFLCCLHPTPFRQGLGHQMARGRCCECSTDPFAAATSLAPFPLLPSGHTAAWACKE